MSIGVIAAHDVIGGGATLPHYFESASPDSLITISAAGVTAEQVITSMNDTGIVAGQPAEVLVNLWEAMDAPGVAKACTARLRDGGPTGTILASHVFGDRGDSAGGRQEQWVLNTVVTPSSGVLCVTIQGNAAGPAITSGQHYLGLIQDDLSGSYANPFTSALVTLSPAGGTTEDVIFGMDAQGLTPGVPVAVGISLWEAMSASGIAKSCTARLRDGGPTGTILASHVFGDHGDGTNGHQEQWSYSGTVTPATSRLCVTMQVTSSSTTVTSDTRTFTVS